MDTRLNTHRYAPFKRTIRTYVDYGAYLIQRGEVGHNHRYGYNPFSYNDHKKNPTIGIGTVQSKHKNSAGGWRGSTISKQQAIAMMQMEVALKIPEQCYKLHNFDSQLPCIKAVILDAAYQGSHMKLIRALNRGDLEGAKRLATVGERNRERGAVRGRAFDMAIMINQTKKANPGMDADTLARTVGKQFYQKYADIKGDQELTKDEFALLHVSAYAACGKQANESAARGFATSYPVAIGKFGIGSGDEFPICQNVPEPRTSGTELAATQEQPSRGSWISRLWDWVTGSSKSSTDTPTATGERRTMLAGVTQGEMDEILDADQQKTLTSYMQKREKMLQNGTLKTRIAAASNGVVPLTAEELSAVVGLKKAKALVKAAHNSRQA